MAYFLHLLLIAPKGIEIRLWSLLMFMRTLLLIAPKGIEIFFTQSNNFIFALLIAPKGIEISENEL